MYRWEDAAEQIALVIPAYEPDTALTRLIAELKPRWPGPILVVDDGSRTAGPVFAQAEHLGATILHHESNLGKGRALKTAFHACLTQFDGLIGCVTADADGQHLPEDILHCARELLSYPHELILGCRNFSDSRVPWKSRWGNRMTVTVMRLFTGISLGDTQTGLRGIPAEFLRCLLEVAGERYEFETNMLLAARQKGLAIRSIPICTVYLEQNRSSHFRPLRDGLRIYLLFFKYTASSLASSVVDLLLFSLFVNWFCSMTPGGYILLSTVLARILSAGVNYAANSCLVFEKRMSGTSVAAYFLLCAVQMMASAGMVTLLFAVTRWPEPLCKVMVDTVLFFVSFQIQNRWIFHREVKK